MSSAFRYFSTLAGCYFSRVASDTTRKAIWFMSGFGALFLAGLRFGAFFRFLGMRAVWHGWSPVFKAGKIQNESLPKDR